MANEIISYKDAKARGLKRYFTGKPCKHGHLSEKFVSNCCCVTCVISRTAIWVENNPELKKQFYKDWIEKHPKYNSEWARKNPDAVRNFKRSWYIRNAKAQVKRASEWQKNNPEKSRANVRNRIARKNAASGSHTAEQIVKMLRKQNWKCAAFGCDVSIKRNRHIDHMMPLILGGSNDISNLQGLCGACNCRKGGKHPDVWNKELRCDLIG